MVPLKGKVIFRLESGQEIELGDLVYNADVEIKVGLEPARYEFVHRERPHADLRSVERIAE